MLRITVSGEEFYDEITNTFSTVGDLVLDLEHSLVSLSKWESEFQKPFLGPGKKTSKEVLDYIKAMIVTPEFPADIVLRFNQGNIDQINEYIDSKQSATTFAKITNRPARSEIISAELIYFWMVSFNVPLECETWHLNRLFSLLRICSIKQSKPKKMSHSELAARNRELNAQRRAHLGSTG